MMHKTAIKIIISPPHRKYTTDAGGEQERRDGGRSIRKRKGPAMSEYLNDVRRAIKRGAINALRSKSKETGIPKEQIFSVVSKSKRLRFLARLSGCTVDELLAEDDSKECVRGGNR